MIQYCIIYAIPLALHSPLTHDHSIDSSTFTKVLTWLLSELCHCAFIGDGAGGMDSAKCDDLRPKLLIKTYILTDLYKSTKSSMVISDPKTL